ncbi:AI-2E family transporter [Natronobeatus ordinarius]|uniref:AI-2E family transporter n=1 Tax=Natronobeatus ordinarius TaxID=2963433 RepID=UPI0020CCA54D|nr:AI-2E family transporter [Natronobeatus ordinarius]
MSLGEWSRASSDRRWLGLLIVVVGVLAAIIVLPYLQYVLAAIVLAYVLYPLRRRLEPRLGRTATAALLLALGTVAIILPLGILVAVAIDEAADLAEVIAAGELGVAEFEDRFEALGLEVDLLALYEQLREPLAIAARGVADQALELAGGVPGFLIGLTVMLFVLYSLLRDGDRLVAWLGRVLPLRADVREELFARVDRLLYVAIVANVAVAAVQAILTTIGLALVGVPSLTFFFILTFVLSLLPLIGASIVWAPISIYLLVVGRPLAGALLFAYGAVIVSLSDNALRPIAVGRGAKMSVATVILGIFGGVAVIGVMGLFFGPVILGTLDILVELYTRERERSTGVTTAVPDESGSELERPRSTPRGEDHDATGTNDSVTGDTRDDAGTGNDAPAGSDHGDR